MKPKFIYFIAALAFVGVIAAACGEGDTVVNSAPGGATGISVGGSGRAVGTPDIVLLQLGVETELPTVTAAREAAASAQQAIVDSLKDNDVDERDIQTVQFTIQPQYDTVNRLRTLRGYRVTNVVSITLREVDKASEVIDDAVAAGGNDIVIRSIAFSIDDPTELREAAREDAVKDAKAKAEQLADAAGVDLGEPISIVEGGFTPLPQAGISSEFARADTATPIQPGEINIFVSVNILYAIE